MIKSAFVKAFNDLISNKEEILESYETIIEDLLDTSNLDKKAVNLNNEMEVVEELLRKLVNENSIRAIDQDEYNEIYNELVERYRMAQDELNEIQGKLQEDKLRKNSINSFIAKLNSQDTILNDFDEGLWASTIEYVLVKNCTQLIFRFKDGRQLICNL